jgi:hypothetical protein
MSDGSPARKLPRSDPAKAFWKVTPKRVIAPSAKGLTLPVDFPSSAGHVEPGVNLGGPPPKAKYSWTTDSAHSSVSEK